MGLSQGAGQSSICQTNCFAELWLADLDAHGAAIGSPACAAMDIRREKKNCAANVCKVANDDVKAGAIPKICRAMLEPNVTFYPSDGTVCVLGQKRYMLTDRSYPGSPTLAQKILENFGVRARVAEYSDLCQASPDELDKFARNIGLGCAFVSVEGCTESASGEQFFICSHHGVLPYQYAVSQDEDESNEDDREKTYDWDDEDIDRAWNVHLSTRVARVDLCCRAGRRLPVLVDTSAILDDSAYSVASAPSCSTRLSL